MAQELPLNANKLGALGYTGYCSISISIHSSQSIESETGINDFLCIWRYINKAFAFITFEIHELWMLQYFFKRSFLFSLYVLYTVPQSIRIAKISIQRMCNGIYVYLVQHIIQHPTFSPHWMWTPYSALNMSSSHGFCDQNNKYWLQNNNANNV